MQPADQLRAAPVSPEYADLLKTCQERRTAAINDRRRYEPEWYICQSFLAGRQWVGWSSRTRRVMELDNPGDRERHTVDVITQYHQTVLGKLYVEELKPELVFSREDVESENIATHSRQLVKYLWDSEVDADQRLYLALHKMLAFGTAALRCYFDPTQGKVLGQVPLDEEGNPIVDPQEARTYMAENYGEAKIHTIREGRIIWEPLSPMQILPPPGVEDPTQFPWVAVDRPMPVEWARMRWPDSADRIEGQELRVADARELSSDGDSSQAPSGAGRLRDHCLITTVYEMPTVDSPEGRVIHFTENELLEVQQKLPYMLKGRPHHGLVFFRYHLVPGRFWGKGVVAPLVGPQRQKNRARSQMIELKDRNLGRVYARKGTLTASNMPIGKIMEVIEIPLHADYPQETMGQPVGPWVEAEARINDEDMDRVSGLREVSLGQAPAGVSAYSAMALLSEQDERRVGPVLKDIRHGIGDAVLLSLELIKKYWPTGKRMGIVGQDGMIEEFMFAKALLPAEFYLDISKHSPLPTSPAAEAQKIFDIFHAAVAAGQPLPRDWLKESLDAGRALPFPKREMEVQRRKAEMEHYFLQGGQLIQPDPFDDDMIHLEVHRAHRFEMEQAMRNGQAGEEGIQLLQLLLQHEQMHMQQAMKKQPQTGGVPHLQGGHGIEAQNGPTNPQGAAQTMSGTAPETQPTA